MTVAAETAVEVAPRDGAQAASADFAGEVKRAEAAIRMYVAAHEGVVWTLRELRDATTEGRTPSVMTTAFFNLEDSGELAVDYVASTITASL